MVPPSTLDRPSVGDLLIGDIADAQWSALTLSRGVHGTGRHRVTMDVNSPEPCSGITLCTSPEPCPVSPEPCSGITSCTSPEPCPVSPEPCSGIDVCVSPEPCPVSPEPCSGIASCK